jgi:predicted TIM-barrel fold metal-dependent hydrolase
MPDTARAIDPRLTLALSRRALLAGLGLSLLACRQARGEPRVPIIDTHIHLVRNLRHGSIDAAVDVALGEMDAFGVEKAIVLPPPFPSRDHPGVYGLAEIKAALRGRPRFAFMAGGESLNPMLQETPADGVSEGLLRRFGEVAAEIAEAGAAGFGELAAEHFSLGMGQHPYESSPPDHPLLLALADIAAKYAMPIELHMEAVPQDMPFPPNRPSGPNPGRLGADIPRFERLLAHNPQARIVWAHAGWDLTGERTVPLMLGLLERHANLFMNIKSDRAGDRRTAPFAPEEDAIRPGWIAMLRAFPDRFMIGSDEFVDQGTKRLETARRFVDALPADLAPMIAAENAKRVYRLSPA